ncbi:extracellular matrix protein 3-like, partial [Amphiura filiformis]|uniref:extracellular matrix protein 3-like n=1 Tax=Amphiura filiformis TaxID=82378 RepID=UPI003B2276C5
TQYYLDCAEYFVVEDDGSVTIRVVRRGDITDTETIRFTATPISAVAEDYEDFENTSNPFEATFMAGSEFLDVSLPITDDVFLEDTESLIVTIEFNDTTSAAVLGHGMGQLDKAVVNIFDDDSKTWFYFDCPEYHASEGDGSVLLTLVRGGDISAAANVTFTAIPQSALLTNDYGSFIPSTALAEFGMGDSTATIELEIVDDYVVENVEQLQVSISVEGEGNYLGELDCATVTITSNDIAIAGAEYYLECAEYFVNEDVADGYATITVCRSGNIADTESIAFTAVGLSASDSEFGPFGGVSIQGVVDFESNTTCEDITLDIDDDELVEETEQVLISIAFTNATLATDAGHALGELQKAVLNIYDDDGKTLYFLDCTEYFVDEDSGNLTFNVMRRGDLSLEITTKLKATSLSADFYADFEGFIPINGEVTFYPGEDTKEIKLQITDDTFEEGLEQLLIEIEFDNPTPAAAAGQIVLEPVHKASVIVDDDDTPDTWYDFDCTVYCVDEGDVTIEITINRKGDISLPGQVNISSTDLSATHPTDYTEEIATIVDFVADAPSKTVPITIASDSYLEDDEHFLVTLHDPLNGVIGDLYKTMVIIKDTNSPVNGTVGENYGHYKDTDSIDTWYDFDCAVYCVDEGDPTFEITINRKGDLSAAGEVEISTMDLSAVAPTDYTDKVNTSVDFVATMTSATVSITIASDTYHETDEHFLITLHDPVNGTVGDLYKTMVIIKDTNPP